MRPIAFVALIGLAAPSIGAQTIDATIDRAVAAWAKVGTVRGTFDQMVSNSLTGSSATAGGEYVQERPNRLAIHFTESATGSIVADGKAVWVYLPGSTPGQVIKRPATDRSASPIDLVGQFLDAPRTKYDITPAGTLTVDGHPARGLTLVPKKGASAPFTKATVWVDDDDSLIRQFEVVEPSGVTRRVHLTTIRTNVPVNRDEFTFSIPKGVKVLDQTKP